MSLKFVYIHTRKFVYIPTHKYKKVTVKINSNNINIKLCLTGWQTLKKVKKSMSYLGFQSFLRPIRSLIPRWQREG